MTRPSSLFNRHFVLLWQGQLVSQMGSQAFLVAMMFWTLEATGSASLMGILLMLSALPAVVLGPVAGTFVDRHSRLRIIVVSDLLRGVVVLLLATTMWASAEATAPVVAALFVAALFNGVVGAVFQPAIAAAIPDLVPPGRVASANSLNQFSAQSSRLLGQALGGVLFRLLGARLLFVVDGISYLLSALSESFIRLPQRAPEPTAGLLQAVRTYWSETGIGLRYVLGDPGRRGFLGVAAGLNFLFMPIFVLLPFFVTDVLGRQADWYGFLLAAISAGSLVGLGVAGSWRLRGLARGRLLVACLVATGAAMGSLAFVDEAVLAAAIALLLGALTAVLNVYVLTLFQVSSPAELRGRVMAIVIALSSVAIPLGMGLGGLLGDLTGKDVPLIYGLCGGLALLWAVATATRPAVRSFLTADHETSSEAEPPEAGGH